MNLSIKRNLIIIGTALFLYIIYVVIIMVLELPLSLLLLTYATIFAIFYFINRKNIMALRGNYFYITGHTQKARPLLKKAVDSGAKSPGSHIYYALLLMQEDGDAHSALGYLDKALRLSKNPVEKRSTLISIATCHWLNKDPNRAIRVLEDMRASQEYVNTSTMVTLGYIYMSKGDLDKALKITNLALEDDSEYASAWDNLGQIYYKKEDFEEAENAFRRALSYKEFLADSNYYMGILSEQKGDTQAAAEYFRKASISTFSFFNSITQEQADEKYRQYHEG